MPTRVRMRKRAISAVFLAVAGLPLAACGPNQRIMNSSNQTASSRDTLGSQANVTPAASSFEQDIEAMRTADFKFILVFRRKDGGPLDASDKELIARNTGPQANRRRLSDEGRAVIIGTNFPFEERLMNELTERFQTENYSREDSGPVTFEAAPAANNATPVR